MRRTCSRGVSVGLDAVPLRVPRQRDHVARERHGVARTARGRKAADQPFLVVAVVVDLVWHHAIALHVRVVDAARSLLLPCRVRPATELVEDVAAHVPLMRDAWRGAAQRCCGHHGALRLLVVPEVHAEVVGRVHRRLVEQLLQQRFDCPVARDLDARPAVAPDLHDEERLRLDVVGMVGGELFEVPYEITAARFVVVVLRALDDRLLRRVDTSGVAALQLLLLVLRDLVVARPSVDPLSLARRRVRRALHCLRREARAARVVLDVGPAHPEIRHRTLGMAQRNLPEAAFGLEVPEAVLLADALVEEVLRLLADALHREVHLLRHPRHQVGGLPRPFVELRAMARVPERVRDDRVLLRSKRNARGGEGDGPGGDAHRRRIAGPCAGAESGRRVSCPRPATSLARRSARSTRAPATRSQRP